MTLIKKIIPKISSLVVAVASLSLCFIANSASSTWCYQAKEPDGIEKYKI